MDANALELFLLAIVGLILGSFAGAVSWRLPRGESVIRPKSRCPRCGGSIAAYDNIPVLSWLILGGRCRRCGERISVRYPLTELATAGLFVACGIQNGTDPELWPALGLMFTLVLVTVTDLEQRIVPNLVMLPSAIAALALWALADPSRLPENLIAAAIGGAAFGAVNLVHPRGMGMGDVKLVAVMGLYLGASLAPALAVALASGALSGVAAALLAGRRGAGVRRFAIPFAPFLAVGGVVGQLTGTELVDWYLRVSGLG